MSATSQELTTTSHWDIDWDIWRCLKCHGALHHDSSASALVCSGCATRLPIENDILVVKDQTSDNNQVAQQFYDSPLWPKFRFWEWFTWLCNGGERAPATRCSAICRPRRASICSTSPSATACISTGSRPTGESSASTSRAPSLRPATAGRPGGRYGWLKAKPNTSRSKVSRSTPCSPSGLSTTSTIPKEPSGR